MSEPRLGARNLTYGRFNIVETRDEFYQSSSTARWHVCDPAGITISVHPNRTRAIRAAYEYLENEKIESDGAP